MNRIRIAIQKSGRLSEHSLHLLQNCGLRFARSKDKLYWYGKDFPVDLLLVRDDDIPRMLLDGVCELGIVGENIAEEVMLESEAGDQLSQLRKLPFGGCRLSLAIPEDSLVKSAADLDGCRIATSYPALTNSLLSKRGINAETVKFSGSVEIAPGLGAADAISDLVSTGTTLRANHLVELETLFESTAALYGNLHKLTAGKQSMLDRLLPRLDGVLLAAESKYVMLHAPRAAIAEITGILPGAENPTLMNLEGNPDRVALHAVCREAVFWEHLEALKRAGASAILVLPVEKMLG
jgi:ATP phosphoribosyltransferase